MGINVVFWSLGKPFGGHFVLNLSPSVPLGIYRKVPREEIRRGDRVLLNPREEGSLPPIKGVVGLPGDLVEITPTALLIDSKVYPKREGVSGYTLSLWRLLPGQFILLGDHPDSYDSRYYGIVDRGEIRSVLQEVVVLN